ncbi:MAG: hypothetical protein ABJH08_10725 [Balneola sp.]
MEVEVANREDQLKNQLKNIVQLNQPHPNEGLDKRYNKALHKFIETGRVTNMMSAKSFYREIDNGQHTVSELQKELFEFISFIMLARDNHKRVNQIPDCFPLLKIPSDSKMYILIAQKKVIEYWIHIRILKGIILESISNLDNELPEHFSKLDFNVDTEDDVKAGSGRKPNKDFSGEQVLEYFNEFLSDFPYPKNKKYWHVGGVQDKSINVDNVAEYIFFEKFKAKEGQFSIASIKDRIEAKVPEKYLPRYRKIHNRKKKN